MDRRVWSLTLTLLVVGLSLFVNDVDAEATPRGFRELFIGRCIDYQQRDIYRWWTSKGYVIALVLGPWSLVVLKELVVVLGPGLCLEAQVLGLGLGLGLEVKKFLVSRSSWFWPWL